MNQPRNQEPSANMTAVIDSRAFAERILEDVALKVADTKEKRSITPGLAVVSVGDDPVTIACFVVNTPIACCRNHQPPEPLEDMARQPQTPSFFAAVMSARIPSEPLCPVLF